MIRSKRLGALLLAAALACGSGLASAESKETVAYIKLDTFTSNLAERTRFLQTAITLKTLAPDAAERVKMFSPVIRHNILLHLCTLTPEAVSTAEGKRALGDHIVKVVNEAIEIQRPENGVVGAMFETFIVQ